MPDSTAVVAQQKDHLMPETRKMLAASPERKIAFLRRRLAAKVSKSKPLGVFIPYLRLLNALQELRTMYVLAADGITGLGLAIWGPSGVGKSTVVRKLIYDLTKEGLCRKRDIVWMDIRSTSGEKRFLKALLRELEVEFSKHDDTDTLLDLVLKSLEALKVKMLVIDEVHNILTGETYRQETLNALKYIWNNSSTAIVLIGTKRLVNLIDGDDDGEMSGRFVTFELMRWESSSDPTYLEFLNLAEKRIPLPDPSGLASKARADEIFEWSAGVQRRILLFIKELVIEAISSGSRSITDAHFQSVRERYHLEKAEENTAKLGAGRP